VSTREVIFLGTSSQVPTRARNHTAFFIRFDDLGILVDPGEGTQRQMVMAGLSASQITHVAITHFHGDHCLGFAGMVQRISLDRVPHPIEVFYPASGEIFFERLRHSSIFHDQSHLVPRPLSARSDGAVLAGRSGKVSFLIHPLDHAVETIGYRLQEDDGRRMLPERLDAAGVRGPAVGALTRDGQVEVNGKIVRVEDVSVPRRGQSVAVTMDTRLCDGARALAKDADLLVSESTYLSTESEEARAHMHMTALEAATMAKEQNVRRLALTHFSQRYTTLEPFRLEATRVHPDAHIAQDLGIVEVPPRDDDSPKTR
jgi:ribonuclease Z